MSITIQGEQDILRAIESKLGKAKTTRVVNKALRETGKDIKILVEDATSSFQQSGETHNTVLVSNVKNNPVKHIDVGWGSNRYTLIHLNEFGYTRYGKYIRPRGMGKLQAAVDKAEATAIKDMKNVLKELTE